MTDFLAAFQQAADQPIVKAIVWPDNILPEHSIRKLKVCVKFWSSVAATEVKEAIAEDEARGEDYWVSDKKVYRWHVRLFWSIIAASVCSPEGQLLFNSEAPKALEEQYDNPQGLMLMNPLWNQALEYNGYGKNPDIEEGTKAKN